MELQQVSPVAPGHTHDHHHHDHGDENLENLFTIGVCGAFGAVAIAISVLPALGIRPGEMLRYVLVPQFHPYVLAAGVVLTILTIIRAVTLWKEAGSHAHHHHDHHHAPGEACAHDHKHDENCDHKHDHAHDHNHNHEHGHHHHAHGHHNHDHEHGGVFWRAVVLLFPIVLFIFGQPNQGFSQSWYDGQFKNDTTLGAGLTQVTAKGGEGRTFTFDELNAFATSAEKRQSEEGKTATVKGQLRMLSEREASLFTEKMTCCASDTVLLKARIVLSDLSFASNTKLKDRGWVEVKGVLQFVADPKTGEFIPVLVSKLAEVKPVAAPW